MIKILDDIGVVFQFVNRWQLDTMAFELNRYAHLSAGIPAGNVMPPTPDAPRGLRLADAVNRELSANVRDLRR